MHSTAHPRSICITRSIHLEYAHRKIDSIASIRMRVRHDRSEVREYFVHSFLGYSLAVATAGDEIVLTSAIMSASGVFEQHLEKVGPISSCSIFFRKRPSGLVGCIFRSIRIDINCCQVLYNVGSTFPPQSRRLSSRRSSPQAQAPNISTEGLTGDQLTNDLARS